MEQETCLLSTGKRFAGIVHDSLHLHGRQQAEYCEGVRGLHVASQYLHGISKYIYTEYLDISMTRQEAPCRHQTDSSLRLLVGSCSGSAGCSWGQGRAVLFILFSLFMSECGHVLTSRVCTPGRVCSYKQLGSRCGIMFCTIIIAALFSLFFAYILFCICAQCLQARHIGSGR